MPDKYLLYIDLLGFSDLVSKDLRRVEVVYRVLDSLNVHRHDMFKTIVFSDTVLVYNRNDPGSDDEHRYIVWYSIEFAEDLHHRLTGQDIYFRAVLTKGEFHHQTMENLQAFYGQAIISAYLAEKEIPSLGLFITDQCNEHNEYFRTSEFGSGLSFVYLNRDIESLCSDSNDTFPIPASDFIHLADGYPYLAWQVKFLADVHRCMRSTENPTVRAKFLCAWDYYQRRYPNLLNQLAENNFALDTVCTGFDFSDQVAAMQRDIEHFGSQSVA